MVFVHVALRWHLWVPSSHSSISVYVWLEQSHIERIHWKGRDSRHVLVTVFFVSKGVVWCLVNPKISIGNSSLLVVAHGQGPKNYQLFIRWVTETVFHLTNEVVGYAIIGERVFSYVDGDLAELMKHKASNRLGELVSYGSSLEFSRNFWQRASGQVSGRIISLL